MVTKLRVRLGGLAGLAAGLVFAGVGLRVAAEAIASARWPQTTGRVERSAVEKQSHRHQGRFRTTYRPQVRYTYEVEGRTYTSDRISFGDAGVGVRRAAAAIAGRYPGGARVPVFHHPERHAESVLAPGLTLGSAGLLLLGAGLAVVSLTMIGAAPWISRKLGGRTVLSRVPEALWGGGAHRLEIDVWVSHPGTIDVTFAQERWSVEDEEWEVGNETEVQEALDPGEHRFSIRVGAPLSVRLAVGLADAPPGAELRAGVRVDGVPRWEETARLDEALEPGYEFCVEAELDELIKVL